MCILIPNCKHKNFRNDYDSDNILIHICLDCGKKAKVRGIIEMDAGFVYAPYIPQELING